MAVPTQKFKIQYVDWLYPIMVYLACLSLYHWIYTWIHISYAHVCMYIYIHIIVKHHDIYIYACISMSLVHKGLRAANMH
jgi:phosphatidylserine synthase